MLPDRALHALAWLFVLVSIAAGVINTARADPVFDLAQRYFPQADRMGAFEGEPLAAPVYEGDELLGYVLRTTDIAPVPAYSGQPITLLVGIYLDGTIAGVRITEHSEPILDAGVSELDLKYFVYQYLDITVEDRVKLGGAEREGYVTIDSITGASITAMVMNATIMKAIKKVAESRGIPLQPDGASLWPESMQPVEIPTGQQAPAWWMGETSEPFWASVWRERWWQVVVLCIALGLLTLILLFQDWLTRRPKLLKVIRNGFLLFTLFFIGWYTLAQPSIIYVLTFINALLHQFTWEVFLVDPLIFIHRFLMAMIY